MKHTQRTGAALAAMGMAVALAVTGCSAGGGGGSTAASKALVVDQSFDLKTADPARAFELTGSIVDRALYETLLGFDGSDVTKPVPQIATYEENADNTVLTLTLNGTHTFSDGTPVTVDDIVFSLNRVQGIKGNPSFLLDGVTVAKVDDKTLTLTTATPNPALPFILPNPSLGILNSKLVKKNGGAEDDSDSAEAFLNKTSAGSGPYEIESYGVTTKVVFKLNPHYAGDTPAYSRVVLENVAGPTQKINVQAGTAQVALGLNADQIEGLDDSKTTTIKGTSPDVIYTWFNQDAAVGAGVTNNKDFLTAVRKGIDYKKIQEIAGAGSTQPGGMVPSQFLGALESDPANVFDADAAKAALAASGYSGQEVTFAYPNDITVNGLQMQTLAEAIQSQLKSVGITLTLAPSPIATFLDAYRAGTLQSGIMYWGPDFPDPSDYLVFNPGQSLGLRAGWAEGTDAAVTQAADAASAAVGDDRAAAYQAWQTAANATGPFVPVLQPGQFVVTAKSVKTLDLNPVWTVDLAAIK
ncbi:ABC transporter substrate-binding protein [Rathayibacter sp. YIM 133350]|uniref:ABC transporter substrate-binding protein n=1 Tax=Rathayibacter sp. YIM 133350 TaxID=3131992 RepID=UPI00307EF8BB